MENENQVIEGNEEVAKVETQTTEKSEGEKVEVKTYTAEEYQRGIDAVLAKKLPPKETMKEFEEWKTSKLTEDEKKNNELNEWKEKYSSLEGKVQQTTLNNKIKQTLKDLEVDETKSDLVKRLIETSDLFEGEDFKDDDLKNRISKVIDEDLPELKKTVKIGAEKQEDTYQTPSNNAYLEAFNKMKR